MLESKGIHHAGLPLSWDISLRGVGGIDDIVFHPDLGSLLAPWTAIKAKKRAAQEAAKRAESEGGKANDPNVMAWVQGMAKPGKKEPGLHPGERYIVKDAFGTLQPGEMMLVVGRPGSGCSSLLKGLAGLTDAYAGTDGTVSYGSMAAGSKEFKPYRSLVCYSSEEDTHDPNLTVGRTMDFATRNELFSEQVRDGDAEDFRVATKTKLLNAFQIGHTAGTKVGDQYVRGVSGESCAT